MISKDGTIYVSSEDRTLYAVTPPTTGTEAVIKWSYTLPPPESGIPGVSIPAIGPDGTVYVSMRDTIYALAAPSSGTEGVLKWSYRDPDSFIAGRLTVGADGTVYIVGRNLLALDPRGNGTNGLLKWSFVFGAGTNYAPTVGVFSGTIWPPVVVELDGTIIWAAENSLTAIRPPVQGTNGTLAWSFPEIHEAAPPTIAADGTVYVAGSDEHVRAVTPPAHGTNGVLKWSCFTDSSKHTGLAIGSDGTVYVAAGVDGLFALNQNAASPDGELKWRYQHNDNKWSSRWPTVGADGTIYVASHVEVTPGPGAVTAFEGTGNVHAISPPAAGKTGTLKWVFQTDGGHVSAPAIGADGTVYVTDDGTLYAIR